MRDVLTTKGVRVTRDGGPFFDFWMARELKTGRPSGERKARFATIAPGTLVGLVRVHAAGTDFRKNAVAKGVYTMRYLVQPEDGDHDGTAETRDFVILSPAALDREPIVLTEKAILEMSSKVTGKKHPAVLHLVAVDAEGGFPRTEARKGLEVFASRVGGGAKMLDLGIVIVGTSPEF